MLVIDQYSYTNGLRDVSLKKKISYSIILILISIMSKSPVFHLIILLLNTYIITFKAKIQLKSYIRLVLIPMMFVLLSIISVVINISTHTLVQPILSYKILNIYVGLTANSVMQGIILFTRSLAAISSSYFMLLTTPMIDLIKFLKFLKLPNEIIEIMVLTYKFIFVLLDESKKIYEAQLMRNGYKNLKNSYQSIGILIKMIFVNSLIRYKKMQETLEIRQFKGEFYI